MFPYLAETQNLFLDDAGNNASWVAKLGSIEETCFLVLPGLYVQNYAGIMWTTLLDNSLKKKQNKVGILLTKPLIHKALFTKVV